MTHLDVGAYHKIKLDFCSQESYSLIDILDASVVQILPPTIIELSKIKIYFYNCNCH